MITTSDFTVFKERQHIFLNKKTNFRNAKAAVYCEVGQKKSMANFIIKVIPEELDFEGIDGESLLMSQKKQFNFKSIR